MKPKRSHDRSVILLTFIIGLIAAMLLGTAGAARAASSDREDALRKFMESYLGPPNADDVGRERYFSTFVELKDDGNSEAIVYVTDRRWCGSGGCTLLVLAPTSSTFELVTKITVTQLPIRVLKTKTNGWHDLTVVVAGGGIPAHEAKLMFDGKTYPKNPSMPPAIGLEGGTEGRVILSASAASAPTTGDPRSAVERILGTQQDAWNRHDLDAFMSGYWNSSDLTFFSGANERHGWQATMDRYKATYQSPGHEMGKLEFSNLRIEPLGPEAAFVRGEWHLTMSDGKTPHGLFTLIFRKFPDGWKIIHDHTSAAE